MSRFPTTTGVAGTQAGLIRIPDVRAPAPSHGGGVLGGLAQAGQAIGGAVTQLGQKILATQRESEIAEGRADITKTIFDSLEAARKSKPGEETATFEQGMAPIQEEIGQKKDNEVREALKNSLTRQRATARNQMIGQSVIKVREHALAQYAVLSDQILDMIEKGIASPAMIQIKRNELSQLLEAMTDVVAENTRVALGIGTENQIEAAITKSSLEGANLILEQAAEPDTALLDSDQIKNLRARLVGQLSDPNISKTMRESGIFRFELNLKAASISKAEQIRGDMTDAANYDKPVLLELAISEATLIRDPRQRKSLLDFGDRKREELKKHLHNLDQAESVLSIRGLISKGMSNYSQMTEPEIKNLFNAISETIDKANISDASKVQARNFRDSEHNSGLESEALRMWGLATLLAEDISQESLDRLLGLQDRAPKVGFNKGTEENLLQHILLQVKKREATNSQAQTLAEAYFNRSKATPQNLAHNPVSMNKMVQFLSESGQTIEQIAQGQAEMGLPIASSITESASSLHYNGQKIKAVKIWMAIGKANPRLAASIAFSQGGSEGEATYSAALAVQFNELLLAQRLEMILRPAYKSQIENAGKNLGSRKNNKGDFEDIVYSSFVKEFERIYKRKPEPDEIEKFNPLYMYHFADRVITDNATIDGDKTNVNADISNAAIVSALADMQNGGVFVENFSMIREGISAAITIGTLGFESIVPIVTFGLVHPDNFLQKKSLIPRELIGTDTTSTRVASDILKFESALKSSMPDATYAVNTQVGKAFPSGGFTYVPLMKRGEIVGFFQWDTSTQSGSAIYDSPDAVTSEKVIKGAIINRDRDKFEKLKSVLDGRESDLSNAEKNPLQAYRKPINVPEMSLIEYSKKYSESTNFDNINLAAMRKYAEPLIRADNNINSFEDIVWTSPEVMKIVADYVEEIAIGLGYKGT